MIGLGLVARAQEVLDVPLLPGMTREAGPRLFEIVESHYHYETRRAALLFRPRGTARQGRFHRAVAASQQRRAPRRGSPRL